MDMIFFIGSALLVNLPLALSPGPANILCFSLSANQGFKRTLKFIAGLQVLPLVYALIVAIGAKGILSQFEDISLVVKVLGSIYLLYLALCMLRSDSAIEEKEEVKGGIYGFYHGVIAQALNPKNIAIIVTIYSLFANEVNNYAYGITLAIIITLCNLSSHLLWSSASHVIAVYADSYVSRYQDKIFGALLLLAVASLWL